MAQGEEAGVGRQREGGGQKRGPCQTKRMVAPGGGGADGDVLSVCTLHTTQVREKNSIMSLAQCLCAVITLKGIKSVSFKLFSLRSLSF